MLSFFFILAFPSPSLASVVCQTHILLTCLNDLFINAAVKDKEDLVTKKETSLAPHDANVSGSDRLYMSMAHAVPSLVETAVGQGLDQRALSSWISSRPIRFHGAGCRTNGFDSLNTLCLQHEY